MSSSLTNSLQHLERLFLLLLPWGTVFIIAAKNLGGIKWEYGTDVLYATEILLGLIFLIFIIWYRHEKPKTPAVNKWPIIFSLGLIAYLFLESLFALDQTAALQSTRFIVEGVAAFWIFLLGPLEGKTIGRWFSYSFIAPALLGLWQFLTQTTFSFPWLGIVNHPAWQAGTAIVTGPNLGRWLRAYAGFPHPNVLGGGLVLAILVILGLRLQEKIANPRQRHIDLLLAGLFTAALFATVSRSAFLALGIVLGGSGIIAMQKKIKHTLPFFLAILGLLGIYSFLFFPILQTRTVLTSPNEITSVEDRQTGYQEALTLWHEHPWFGIGPGNYTIALAKQYPRMSGWAIQPVHNVFLLALTELGIIGSIILLTSLGTIILSQTRRQSRVFARLPLPDGCRPDGGQVFVCFCVFVTLTLFDHYLYSLYPGLMLSAIFWASVTRRIHEETIPTSSPVYAQLP